MGLSISRRNRTPDASGDASRHVPKRGKRTSSKKQHSIGKSHRISEDAYECSSDRGRNLTMSNQFNIVVGGETCVTIDHSRNIRQEIIKWPTPRVSFLDETFTRRRSSFLLSEGSSTESHDLPPFFDPKHFQIPEEGPHWAHGDSGFADDPIRKETFDFLLGRTTDIPIPEQISNILTAASSANSKTSSSDQGSSSASSGSTAAMSSESGGSVRSGKSSKSGNPSKSANSSKSGKSNKSGWSEVKSSGKAVSKSASEKPTSNAEPAVGPDSATRLGEVVAEDVEGISPSPTSQPEESEQRKDGDGAPDLLNEMPQPDAADSEGKSAAPGNSKKSSKITPQKPFSVASKSTVSNDAKKQREPRPKSATLSRTSVRSSNPSSKPSQSKNLTYRVSEGQSMMRQPDDKATTPDYIKQSSDWRDEQTVIRDAGSPQIPVSNRCPLPPPPPTRFKRGCLDDEDCEVNNCAGRKRSSNTRAAYRVQCARRKEKCSDRCNKRQCDSVRRVHVWPSLEDQEYTETVAVKTCRSARDIVY